MKNDNLRGQRSQLILNDETMNARLCNRCLLADTCNISLAVLNWQTVINYESFIQWLIKNLCICISYFAISGVKRKLQSSVRFEERKILPFFKYYFIKFYYIFNFYIYIGKIKNQNNNTSMFSKIRCIICNQFLSDVKTKKNLDFLFES